MKIHARPCRGRGCAELTKSASGYCAACVEHSDRVTARPVGTEDVGFAPCSEQKRGQPGTYRRVPRFFN